MIVGDNSNNTHTNKRISVRTIPAIVKMIPFLKILVFGINIQKEEITKKNRETPKNMLRKNSGSEDLALCSPVSLLITKGSSFTLYSV